MNKAKILITFMATTMFCAHTFAVPSDTGFKPDAGEQTAIEYGQGLYESGHYEQAQETFQSILDEDANDQKANYLMGLSHMGLNQADEAIPYFEKVIQLDNSYYAAREQLGLAFLMKDDVEKAQEQLDMLMRAFTRCGVDCDISLTTAVGSLNAAIENHGKSADMGSLWDQPEHQIALQDSISNIHQHNYELAIELLSNTLASTGDHPDILNYLGFAHRKLGLYDQAIAYYRRALAIDPDHLGANEYLGELYVEIGDLDRARMQLAKLDALCAFGCNEHQELARWISEAGALPEQQAI